jgi:outer membrane lipase/esterase
VFFEINVMMVPFFPALRQRGLRFAGAFSLSLAAFLAGCGSGSTFEPLVPTRFVSFGDGMSDLGQTGSRYTVNDGSTNIWVQQLAASYGRNITASATVGGLGFATGDARVSAGTNPISLQITNFLAANSIGASDVLVVDAGIAELVALAAAHPTDNAALAAAADVAGKALGAQVKRLTAAGAKHVVIGNSPDLGKTPYAVSTARVAGLTAATRAFNDGIKIALADVTNAVLLVDNEAYINTIYNSPTTLGAGGNNSSAACSTPTALTCTASTLAAVVRNYNLHMFADDRYPTPALHRLVGTNAYNQVKARW